MIFYIVACIGFTFIIKYGSILKWLRTRLIKYKIFKELFSCSLCIGFWTGSCIGIVGWFLEADDIYILLPFVSAAVCWFSDCVIGILQSIEKFLDNKNK